MPKCQSCNATIVFTATKGGKLAPFESDPDGEWALDDEGTMVHVGKASHQLTIGETQRARWTSHFARCKDADKWRKK